MTPPIKPPVPAHVPEPVQHPATLEGLVRRIGDRQIATDKRVANIENDVAEIKGHLIATKAATRQTSQNDMRHDAAIAKLTTMIEANNEMTAELKKSALSVMKHPAVVAFGLALITFLTAWLGRHTP